MYNQLLSLRSKQEREFNKDAVMIADRLGYPVSRAITKFGSGIIDRVRKHNKPVKKIGSVDGSYYRQHCYNQPVNVYGLATFIIKSKTRHQVYNEYLTLYGYQLASDLANIKCGKIFCMPSTESIDKQITETQREMSKAKTRIRTLTIQSVNAELDHNVNLIVRLLENTKDQEEEYASLQERLTSLIEEREASLIAADRVGSMR